MPKNSSNFILEKAHNVLYIAAKLCYDWRIKNNILVSAIIKDIFQCERDFKKIFFGALFGSNATKFFTGWKSDFDESDGDQVLVYFLNHSVKAKLEFYCESVFARRR